MDCTPWPGHQMASTLLQRREAVLITMQIIQYASGMPPAERLSLFIAVMLIMCLPWPGRPPGNISHRLHRITRYQYGERGESASSACLPFLPGRSTLRTNLSHLHSWMFPSLDEITPGLTRKAGRVYYKRARKPLSFITENEWPLLSGFISRVEFRRMHRGPLNPLESHERLVHPYIQRFPCLPNTYTRYENQRSN